MSTSKFMENFIKAQIIEQFVNMMILEENVKLRHLPKLLNPILTFTENEEHSMKFALTNVMYWDGTNLHGDSYTIDGLVIDTGLIIITGYSITNLKED